MVLDWLAKNYPIIATAIGAIGLLMMVGTAFLGNFRKDQNERLRTELSDAKDRIQKLEGENDGLRSRVPKLSASASQADESDQLAQAHADFNRVVQEKRALEARVALYESELKQRAEGLATATERERKTSADMAELESRMKAGLAEAQVLNQTAVYTAHCLEWGCHAMRLMARKELFASDSAIRSPIAALTQLASRLPPGEARDAIAKAVDAVRDLVDKRSNSILALCDYPIELLFSAIEVDLVPALHNVAGFHEAFFATRNLTPPIEFARLRGDVESEMADAQKRASI